MTVKRRDHNLLPIQPKNQDSDSSSYKFSGQTTYRNKSYYNFVPELLFIAFIITVPLMAHAGIFDSFTNGLVSYKNNGHQNISVTNYDDDSGFLKSTINNDPYTARGGGEIFIEEGVFIPGGPIGNDEIATSGITNGDIRVRVVRENDTLSQIAEQYNVTSNTILWANDLSGPTDIRPGDTLIILPIAGVQHEIARGDTVEALAVKYKSEVDDILAYNQLSSNADLEVGNTIVIPGGVIAPPPAPVRETTGYANASTQPTTNQNVSTPSAGWLTHPAPGTVRTQGLHGYNAIDFGGPVGTPIRASAAGEVIVSRNSGWNGGYGNYIVIRHPNGVQTLYSHNHVNYVGVGEYVSSGQVIAEMGSTGRSTGPHLHFEVRGAHNPF